MNKLSGTSSYALGFGMSINKVCYRNTPSTKGMEMETDNDKISSDIAKIISEQDKGLITKQEMVDELLEVVMVFSAKLPEEVVPEWVATSTFRADGFDD